MPRLRVLVADNDVPTSRSVTKLLAGHFDVVGSVHDGAEMLAAAKVALPDVLVVDVAMPVLNGIDAVRCYRRTEARACVIFLSNYAEPAIVDAALEAGGDAFVKKERAADELIELIERLAASKAMKP